MATTPNIHPVRFNFEQHCSMRDMGWRQPVQWGDDTQFQFSLDICESERNLIINESFNTNDSWVVIGTSTIDTANGWGVKSAGNNTGSIVQYVPITDGIQFFMSFDVEIQSGSVLLEIGTYSEIFTESGTYSRYITAESVVSVLFYGEAESAYHITSIGMYPLNTSYIVRVVDLDGATVRELSVSDNPEFFNVVRNWITFTYDWRDEAGDYLDQGCYSFEVSEPCECLNGGLISADFVTGSTTWTNRGNQGWIIIQGTAYFLGTYSPDNVYLDNIFCEGEEYEITYTLTNMSGNEFRIGCGSALGVMRSADGTYTETITCGIGNYARFIMFGYNLSGASAFQVTELQVQRKTRSFRFQSNLFNLKEYHPCTSVIAACCDSDNLQAGYGDTFFQPRMRLKLIYGKPAYEPISLESYKGAFGSKRNYYYRGEKTKLLQFGCSEYAHDFIGHLAGYDHVYIDGDSIFINSAEYSPSWDTIWDWGEGELQVSNKVELIEKRRCSSITTGCEGSLPIAIDSHSGGLGGTDGGTVIVDKIRGIKSDLVTAAATG